MKLNEIEKVVLNKYTNLDKKENDKYLLKEIRFLIDKNLKIDVSIKDIIYLIELNENKIDKYILKLIESNKIDIKQLYKVMERDDKNGK